jgi:hypothetical protein
MLLCIGDAGFLHTMFGLRWFILELDPRLRGAQFADLVVNVLV